MRMMRSWVSLPLPQQVVSESTTPLMRSWVSLPLPQQVVSESNTPLIDAVVGCRYHCPSRLCQSPPPLSCGPGCRYHCPSRLCQSPTPLSCGRWVSQPLPQQVVSESTPLMRPSYRACRPPSHADVLMGADPIGASTPWEHHPSVILHLATGSRTEALRYARADRLDPSIGSKRAGLHKSSSRRRCNI